MDERPRDGDGKILETLGSVERDTEALRMRSRGHTFDFIAQHLGYGNRSNAHRAVRNAVKAMQKEHADEVYAQQVENLNNMRRAVYEVLEKNHVVVQQGKIIMTPEFDPLIDYKPLLEAVDRLLKIEDRFARLHGLDTVKLDVTVEDATDVKIRTLVEQLEARNRADEEALRAQP